MGISIDDATYEQWCNARHAYEVAHTQPDIEALNTLLNRPWGEVDLLTRAYVFLLHQTGKVQILMDGAVVTNPSFGSATYQVRAVEKPKTKPSINWSQIRPEYKWLARDLNGKAWVYTHEPAKHTSHWRFPLGDGSDVSFMTSYTPGDCDWQDSLVERPAGI